MLRSRAGDAWIAAVALLGAAGIGWYSDGLTLSPAKLALPVLAICVLITVAIATRWWTMLAIPLVLLLPPSIRVPISGIPDLTPQRLVIVLALGMWLVQMTNHDFAFTGVRHSRWFRPLPKHARAAAGVFVAYVLVISLHAGGLSTLSRGIGYSLEALAPAWLMWQALRRSDDIMLVVDVLLGVMLVASLLALYEKVGGHYLIAEKDPYFFHPPSRTGAIRVQGIFPHPLVYGSAAAMMIPVAFTRWYYAIGDRRWLAGGAGLVMLAGLALSLGRGPWMAGAIALVLLVALLRQAPQATLIAAVMAAATLVSFSPLKGSGVELVRGVINSNAGQDAGAYTVEYRKLLISESEQYAKGHPLGAGPGKSGTLHFDQVVGGHVTNLALSIDNAYAKYAVEIGTIGLLLLLVLLGTAMRYAWLARAHPDPAMSALASGIFCGQVAILVASFTVATLTWAQLSALYWLLTGCGLAIWATVPTRAAPSRLPPVTVERVNEPVAEAVGVSAST